MKTIKLIKVLSLSSIVFLGGACRSTELKNIPNIDAGIVTVPCIQISCSEYQSSRLIFRIGLSSASDSSDYTEMPVTIVLEIMDNTAQYTSKPYFSVPETSLSSWKEPTGRFHIKASVQNVSWINDDHIRFCAKFEIDQGQERGKDIRILGPYDFYSNGFPLVPEGVEKENYKGQ